MITKMYVIYDSKAEIYNQPFHFINDGQATRQFSDAVNNPETDFAKHPEDYTLFRIGTYDDSTTKIETTTPISLGVGIEFLNTP